MHDATLSSVRGSYVARKDGGHSICPIHGNRLERYDRNAVGQERFSCHGCGTGEDQLWYRQGRVIMRKQ